jgi:hypothetical protein
MVIEAKIFRTLRVVVPILAIPAVLLYIFDLSGALAHKLHAYAFPFLTVLCFTGAIVAILERFGVIQFHYRAEDKTDFHYRMARQVAEGGVAHRPPLFSSVFPKL